MASYVGLRNVACSGTRFLLNGRPYFLRMVLAQNYWPQSHLAAPSPQALREEVEWVKELGFNGVRIHQKIEDPRFLYWCDRLGLVAWGEMPSAQVFDTETLAKLTREWLEVLERDASVPSLVTWVPLNESWGVPSLENDPAQRDAVRGLYHLTKAIDPTRPVIGNDGWEHLVSDIFGVHDYSAGGDLLRQRYGSAEALQHTMATVQPYYKVLMLADPGEAEAPLMVTEFGGITFDPDSEDFWNGYGAVHDAAELLGPLYRPGRRAARQPGRGRLLLHPAHRHRPGAERPAGREPQAQGRPGRHPGRQPATVRRGAGGRHRRDPDRARRAPQPAGNDRRRAVRTAPEIGRVAPLVSG